MTISLDSTGIIRSNNRDELRIRWADIMTLTIDKNYIRIINTDIASLAKDSFISRMQRFYSDSILIPVSAFSNRNEADNFYALCVQYRQAALNNETIILPEAPETWPPEASDKHSLV